jgi:hypothetical protein
MKTKILFPSSFGVIGRILFLPALALGIANFYWEFEIGWLALDLPNTTFFFEENQNLTNELVMISLIGSLFMMGFSKEKNESEELWNLRLQSLLFAVWLNYILMLFCIIFFYNLIFLQIMAYHLFSILVIFIIKFQYEKKRVISVS